MNSRVILTNSLKRISSFVSFVNQALLLAVHYMFAMFVHWQKTPVIITKKINKLNIFRIIRLQCNCCFKWNQY